MSTKKSRRAEEDFNPTICNAATQQTSNYVSVRQQLQPQQLLLQHNSINKSKYS